MIHKIKLYRVPNGEAVFGYLSGWRTSLCDSTTVRLIAKYGIHDHKRGLILLPYGAAVETITRLLDRMEGHISNQTSRRHIKVWSIMRRCCKCAGGMIKIGSGNKLTFIASSDISDHEYDRFMKRHDLKDNKYAKHITDGMFSSNKEKRELAAGGLFLKKKGENWLDTSIVPSDADTHSDTLN